MNVEIGTRPRSFLSGNIFFHFRDCTEAVAMNGRFQMQGGKNWFLPKEINANRFFCDSHWLEIWSNHFYPSMGPNGGSVAMDSALSWSLKYSPGLFNTLVVHVKKT